ncbi:MAG TPA: DegV family protein, partial [Deinococcales bacterium]|nr:DegV family protein [Deinococcales bacterium]
FVVTCSAGFSGTNGVAQLAARDFPGRVTVWDSAAGCGTQQMQAERAARLFRAGAGEEEVLAALERARNHMNVRFTVGSLDFLRKNGRIGNATALLGQLLSVRPILTMAGGKVDAAGRARGDRRAFQDQVDNLKALVQRHGRVRAFYLYTDQPDKARELKAAGDALGVECFGMNQMGAVISCHVGPGTFGACSEPVDP